jgi:hypothetical protein
MGEVTRYAGTTTSPLGVRRPPTDVQGRGTPRPSYPARARLIPTSPLVVRGTLTAHPHPMAV